MGISVTIDGSSYTIPVQGENPPWGTELTAVLVALVNQANSIVGPADITTTSFSIVNNVSSPAQLSGASFDTSQVQAFIMDYSIYRSTSTQEESEVGVLYGTYYRTAGRWDLSQTYGGGSGIVFSINNAGQISYTSTNLTGSNYQATIQFSAKAFLQS